MFIARKKEEKTKNRFYINLLKPSLLINDKHFILDHLAKRLIILCKLGFFSINWPISGGIDNLLILTAHLTFESDRRRKKRDELISYGW